MTLSIYIPTLRGWLALAAGVADAIIVPALIPAYDGPRASILDWSFAVLLAVVTFVLCFRSLHRTRIPDRLAGLVAGVLGIWMLYEFIRRAA